MVNGQQTLQLLLILISQCQRDNKVSNELNNNFLMPVGPGSSFQLNDWISNTENILVRSGEGRVTDK
jgi:hypothetical protein